MWPLLLKFIGKQGSGKVLRQGYNMLPWQPHLDAMFTQILTF